MGGIRWFDSSKNSSPSLGLNCCLVCVILLRLHCLWRNGVCRCALSKHSAFPSLISVEWLGGQQNVSGPQFKLQAWGLSYFVQHHHHMPQLFTDAAEDVHRLLVLLPSVVSFPGAMSCPSAGWGSGLGYHHDKMDMLAGITASIALLLSLFYSVFPCWQCIRSEHSYNGGNLMLNNPDITEVRMAPMLC